jgi:16S rRNA (guanine(1405)-N(7))-methyltransferase
MPMAELPPDVPPPEALPAVGLPSASPALAQVMEAVRSGAKYREVDPSLVAALAARELSSGARPKDAAKAVKNKLHQVAGAYQIEPLRGESWLAAVRSALAEGIDVRPLCRELMARHASTRERLPILDSFYAQVLDGLPPIASILDLACGLNPLSLPWMSLAPGATYWACDIYADQVALLNGWFSATGQAGMAFACDLTAGAPAQAADVALLLKAIPCLQQIDRSIGPRLLDSISAPVLIVSYPVHSLGGRKHGMPEQYAEQFARLVAGRNWQIDTFHFATELVFRIRR